MADECTLLAAAKLALRITTDAFDSQISHLLNTALLDMDVAGVITDSHDPLIQQAAITYVRLHFGQPDEYDRLKKSYDEQKAQLATNTGHTEW